MPYTRYVTNSEVRHIPGCQCPSYAVTDRRLRLFGHAICCLAYLMKIRLTEIGLPLPFSSNGNPIQKSPPDWKRDQVIPAVEADVKENHSGKLAFCCGHIESQEVYAMRRERSSIRQHRETIALTKYNTKLTCTRTISKYRISWSS